MRVTRFDARQFDARHEEAMAVRLFLWVGLATTTLCAGLAAFALARPLLF